MKSWFRSRNLTVALAIAYVIIMMIPNTILAYTEPYGGWSKAVSVILPLGFYMLWSVLFRRSGVTIWLSFPFIFFGAFQIVLLYLFGDSIIACDMFTNLLTTNPGEAGELLASIWPSVLIVCFIYIPLLWRATVEIRNKRAIPRKFAKPFGVCGALLLLLGVLMLIPARMTKVRDESVLKNEVFPISVLYNLKLSISEFFKMKNFESTSQEFIYEASRAKHLSDKREIYVFVIGEAARAASWQLYGSERETTPKLAALTDLVLYKNMLTQSNTTHKSVPMILSSIDTHQHDELFLRKGLPQIFNEAGFSTWFISNQAPQSAMVDKLAADSQNILYMDNPHFDMQMLEAMKSVVEQDRDSDLFFILHSYGSHFSYHQRYPREFAKYMPDDDVSITHSNIEMIRNAYDNSTLYTDHFLDSLIEYLRGLEEDCTAMFYCSDHGEDLLDDDRDRFLHASPTVTYYQLHVASLAWFSENYRESYERKYEAALANTMAPATTRSCFHTVADMASILSPYLDTELSLCSPSFDYNRTRYYLNDHNQAERFYNMGLVERDLEIFRKEGIEL